MPLPMYPHTLPLGFSRPTSQLFQHLPETIQLVILIYKLIHTRQNTAHFDAYLNTISIYIRLLERFYKAKPINFNEATHAIIYDIKHIAAYLKEQLRKP